MLHSRLSKLISRGSAMLLLPAAACLLGLVASCASMGRPEGGPKDELPPVFLSSDPLPGALGVKSTKYRLRFDENIQVKDIMKNVIVSPAQKKMPKITGNGRVVTVELNDSLRDSTTYTIDFGDAILDLNEGNILDGFSFAFSTGPTIDTLAISGMVFQAENLEPAQGMIVGVYPAAIPDSAILNEPLDRVTRTNQYGQFTLRNLAPGSYRIYALNDMNSDYRWDRSEDIAFLGETITPTAEPITVTDTITASDGSDSIVTVPSTLFLPNDVILTWFNENYKPSYITTYRRQLPSRMSLIFNAPMDSMPELRLVAPANSPAAALDGKPLADWGLAQISERHDTFEIYIADSAAIRTDSLYLSARYLKTDTTDRLTWATDTLRMFFRYPKNKKGTKKENEKKDEEAEGDSAVAKEPEIPEFKLSITANVQQLNQPLVLKLEEPIASIDSLAATLEVKPEGDTIWVPVRGFRLSRPAGTPLLQLRGSPVDWLSGASYRLRVDSAAIKGIYGTVLRPFESEFKARDRKEYSTIILTISGTGGRKAVAQLLDKDDKVLRSVPVDGSRAIFDYLEPDTYYARLFFDENGNGLYDNGSLLDSIQPEEVVYFPKRIPLKKNWDLEQSWNIYEIPLDLQKPSAIKKNKPKKKEGETDSGEEEDEQQYDEFGRPIQNGEYQNPFGSSGNRNNRGGNSLGGLGGGNRGLMNNTRR